MSDRASADWLVSPRFDLLAFGLPAAVALALVPLGPWLAPSGDTPLPMWLIAVLGVDVAHVWSTLHVTYLDPRARARHGTLFAVTPLLAFAVGSALAALSFAVFWTLLAYLAVFHFVRQQYGWVALFHRKDPSLGPLDRRLDVAMIYASTLVPLVWWHAHLPRGYVWFVPGDFVVGAVPPLLAELLLVPYVGLLAAWPVRQLWRVRAGASPRPGLALVVVGTAACWGVGIIVTNTDWAFTVTNVLIHGVPYFGLVWIRAPGLGAGPGRGALARAGGFYGLLLALAYVEELSWDRLVWHEGAIFVGPAIELGELGVALATGLLAVPQVTHYVLDGVIWRRPRQGGPAEAMAAAGSV